MNQWTVRRDPTEDGDGSGEGGGASPGYRVAVLVAEGSDAVSLRRLNDAMHRHAVATILVAPETERPELSDGLRCEPDVTLRDRGGLRCDAVAMILSACAADRLADDANAREFVMDAWHAGQAIAHDIGAALLLDACGIRGDEFVLPVECVADLLVCLPRRCARRTPRVSRSA